VRRVGAAVVVVVVGVAITAAGCGRRQAAAPGPATSALLAAAAELGAAPDDVVRAWQEVGRLAERVAARREPAAADRLNAVVFGELGYEREVERTDLGFVLLPSVIAGRRGSCVGLSSLYLAVAERAGLAMEPVMVPGHFFVRAPGPPPRNVELLRRGEAMPDEWYRGKYGPWDAGGVHGRGLAATELGAVVWFNAGNERRRAGDVAGAARAFARAAADFPAFAEAQASLGATRQLQGDLPGAEDAYRAAARARPDLPGLGQNLTLLDAEASATFAAKRKGDR